MNIAALLAVAIQIAGIFGSSSKFMATIKSLLEALSKSPELLEWLTTMLSKPAVPETAMPMEADLRNDEALKAAFDNSPAAKDWAAMTHKQNVPDTAEALGVGGLLTLLTYLPQILALLKQLKESGILTK